MATNLTGLTKDWIQYLKNNRIVSTQSDPKTGRLNYRKNPSATDLMKFLNLKTDFDESAVRQAIKTVLNSKQGQGEEQPKTQELPAPQQGGELSTSTAQHTEISPGERQSYREPIQAPDTPKKYSNDDAEDIAFREPGQEYPAIAHKKKPRVKYSDLKKGLREDFYDREGAELDENDIKQIFKILLTPQAEPEQSTQAEPGQENLSDEEKLVQRQQYMRQLKELIRDAMTPEQRKALWRVLNQQSLSEAIITNADAEEIFRDASASRNKTSGLGRLFPGLRKDKVNFEDLRQTWANGLEPDGSDGYSNDTNDIKRILLKFGYGEKEINSIFAQVFKTSDHKNYDDRWDAPRESKAVQKVADIAQKHGLSAALKNFLEAEFAKELGLDKRATNEDIRQIFEQILQVERTARPALIKQQEHIQLGRSKK